MALKLHRCKNVWLKTNSHPCWKVQKALDEMGVEYEIVRLPWPLSGSGTAWSSHTGQPRVPGDPVRGRHLVPRAVEGHGATIRAGRLDEKHGVTPLQQPHGLRYLWPRGILPARCR